MKLKRHLRTYGFGYILLAVCIAMLAITQTTALPSTIFGISLRQASVLGVLALGLTFVVFTGSVDLSCGAILSLSGGLCTGLYIEYHVPMAVAILAAVLVAGLCGLLNGVLTIRLNLPSSIITFATMILFSGLGQLTGVMGLPLYFLDWGRGTLLGLPNLSWIWFALFALAALMLRYTYLGRFLYAIGDSPQALETMAVNVAKYRVAAYMLSGVFAGISGILMLTRTGLSTPNSNISLVFDSLIAITLGGISLRGGRGNIAGVMLGIMIVTLLSISMITYGLQDYEQNIIRVIVFLIAVFLDRGPEGEPGGKAGLRRE